MTSRPALASRSAPQAVLTVSSAVAGSALTTAASAFGLARNGCGSPDAPISGADGAVGPLGPEPSVGGTSGPLGDPDRGGGSTSPPPVSASCGLWKWCKPP